MECGADEGMSDSDGLASEAATVEEAVVAVVIDMCGIVDVENVVGS